MEDPIAESIKTALSATRWKCSKLERISGGNANFTYRGHLESDGSIVIKHAEPYVAPNKEFQLDVGRSDYERLMLETLSEKPATKSERFVVRTPKVLHTYTQTPIIEDLPGSLTVKEYLSRYGAELGIEVSHELGVALGSWLAWLHGWLNGDNAQATSVRGKLKDNPMVGPREGLYIGSYKESMEQFPQIQWPSNELFNKIEECVKKMYRCGGQAIHGDFWTGNMILQDKPLSRSKESGNKLSEIFILDFEVSQLGSCAQDIAQCLAELYMVHHFFGANAPLHVMHGVADGYFGANARRDATLALQITMHFGIHIVVIPWRYGWPQGDKLVECVRFGNDCLVNGFEGKVEWFKGGPLGFLFPS